MRPKKIAIVRPGKVLSFGAKYLAADKGQEDATVALLRHLRDKNPDIEFRFASKARFEKGDLEREWSGNLKYVYEEYIQLDKNGVFTGWDEPMRQRVHQAVADCDAILIIGGPTTDVPNPILKQPEEVRGKALPRFWRYWTPTADTLEYNQGKPWIWLYFDPRNPLTCRDFKKGPDVSLGFKDGEKLRMRSGYPFNNDEKIIEYETEFGYMEFLGVYGMDIQSLDAPIPPKPDLFTITQHKLTSWRGKQFTKLIDPLPWTVDDLKIYGDWGQEKEHDNRYLGPIAGSALYQETVSRAKYSFALPIHPGWATPKIFHFWKNDVVFFTDKNMDSDGHYIPTDHFTRVESPEELYQKINYIEQNEDLYTDLIMWQRHMLHKHVNGNIFNNLLMERFEQAITGTLPKEYWRYAEDR